MNCPDAEGMGADRPDLMTELCGVELRNPLVLASGIWGSCAETLIRAGLEEELDPEVRESKMPETVVSDSFEFEKFSERPHVAIAQSLFTHLPPSIINLCFEKLRGFRCRVEQEVEVGDIDRIVERPEQPVFWIVARTDFHPAILIVVSALLDHIGIELGPVPQ